MEIEMHAAEIRLLLQIRRLEDSVVPREAPPAPLLARTALEAARVLGAERDGEASGIQDAFHQINLFPDHRHSRVSGEILERFPGELLQRAPVLCREGGGGGDVTGWIIERDRDTPSLA